MIDIIGTQQEVDTAVGTDYLTGGSAHLYEVLMGGLQTSIVPFAYRKKDGTIRFAVGTLNHDLIPVSGEQMKARLDSLKALVQPYDFDAEVGKEQEDVDDLLQVLRQIKEELTRERAAKESTVSPENQVYYDFEAKGWRQFKKDSLVLAIAQRQ